MMNPSSNQGLQYQSTNFRSRLQAMNPWAGSRYVLSCIFAYYQLGYQSASTIKHCSIKYQLSTSCCEISQIWSRPMSFWFVCCTVSNSCCCFPSTLFVLKG